jgi:hypothetical protein
MGRQIHFHMLGRDCEAFFAAAEFLVVAFPASLVTFTVVARDHRPGQCPRDMLRRVFDTRGGHVPIIAVFQAPSLTQEKYEETIRRLAGKPRLSSPSDWPVEGLLVHASGQGENGFRVVDVWASEDAFRRFGEKLAPILREVGIEGQPEVYPSHTVVTGALASA